MKRLEEVIHTNVCNYIKYQYPGVLFTSESSGIRVGIGLARKMKAQRSQSKLPDLIILEPSPCGTYHGLMIEIKKDMESVYKKNGEYRETAHIQGQREVLDKLTKKGYFAAFGCGFDHCRAIIDRYMSGKMDVKMNETNTTPPNQTDIYDQGA